MVAQVQSSWIESAGAHLVRRTYGEAQWSPERGMVLARETVSLYGRVLSSGRQVNFATVDPATARRMFVEEALVRRRSALGAAFLDRNEALRRSIEALEAKLRRRDLMAADDVLVAWYLERIPADVASVKSFEHWWRGEERRSPHRLDVPREVFAAQPWPAVPVGDFPDAWSVDGNELRLSYRFDPVGADDGVTLDVPLPLLGQLSAAQLDWLVPGFLREKVIALMRGLPKELRRGIVPIPDAAARFVAALRDDPGGMLFERLAQFVTAEAGQVTGPEVLRAIDLPPWLRFNLRVLDETGHELRRGRNLEVLRRELHVAAAHVAGGPQASEWQRDGVRRWDFGELPEDVRLRMAGVTVRMFPALEDGGGAARLRLCADAIQAEALTRDGVLRLAALAMPQQYDLVRRMCSTDREITLLAAATGHGRALFDEVADRAVMDALEAVGGERPRNAVAFDAAIDAARGRVADCGQEVLRVVRAVLAALRDARGALSDLGGPAFASGQASVRRNLDALTVPGWVRRTPEPWFHQLPKYVRAAERRAVRLRNDVERDRKLDSQVASYVAALQVLDRSADSARPAPERERLRWMIEEFRVSLFAQELRTLTPVSAKRLDEQLRRAQREK
jgi:ATP-dependent helicase HrpA